MTTESLRATEAVGARGATHPRVKLDDIEKSIALTIFRTADVLIPDDISEDAAAHTEPLKILTICVIVMFNGFVILGYSAPASPENFNKEKGEEFAYENALRQVWPLMGFALRDRLHRDTVDTAAYMRATGQDGSAVDNTDLAGGELEAVADESGFENDELEAVADESGFENDELETAGVTAADFANPGPHPIEDDETLEGSGDSYIKALALEHGFEYVDRADAIAKLKVKRDSILAQTRA